MTDNLQMDVLSSLLKYSEDIRERGELDLLTDELFTHDLFGEIYTGLRSRGFIPSAYIDSISDSEFRQYVNSLKSRGMYNKSFPEIVGALREKSAKDRVSTEMQSLLLSGNYSTEKAMQIINDYGCSSNYTPICAADIEPKPIEWVMQNFIPRGMLSSLQGLPDVGKSFLTGAITTAVTNDYGRLPDPSGELRELGDCVHGNVLIFNSDDSPAHTTIPRLKSMGANLDRVFFENPDSEPITFADERLPSLLERIKPALVIFDPIQNFVGEKVDFNRANSIHPVMRKLELLAMKHNCGILCVQHISKGAANGSGGASVSWGLGSMAINGIFRCVWTVGRLHDPDNPYRRAVLSAKANIVAGIPPAYLFDLDPESGFRWAGVSTEVTAKDLIREQHAKQGRPSEQSDRAEEIITEILEENDGEMFSADLWQAVESEGISKRTYRNVKKDMGIESFQRGRQWFVRLQKVEPEIEQNEFLQCEITECDLDKSA
jgi:hypothetical protein